MKPIEAFECPHCKKIFRTNRHKCKFDPELENCFTCKHLKGWEKGSRNGCYIEPNYPDCNAGCGDWDIQSIKLSNYFMQCECYERGKYEFVLPEYKNPLEDGESNE